jgi:predicted alpha-1,6-mannanase (GH76 family)
VRRVWGLPGTLLGVCASPATPAQRAFQPWNYWWQAHLLDCLVDAWLRAPTPARRTRVDQLINGIRVRNARGWRNDYHDDGAWLALALERAQRLVLGRRPRTVAAIGELSEALYEAWTEDGGGGIWWRAKDAYREDFKNVPANGPAAILFARLREPRGYETGRWIETHLVDHETGVVWDGLHVSPAGGIREIETTRYTYGQGVFLGVCLELAEWDRDGAEAERWAGRAVRTLDAVAEHFTVDAGVGADRRTGVAGAAGRAADKLGAQQSSPADVLRGQGGGDGGLFAGILARYLAQAALVLPEFGPGYTRSADVAAHLVFASAQAAWDNRVDTPTGPLFGAEWSVPVVAPAAPRPGGVAEHDLSVQVGAWMLMEAAALLARAGEWPNAPATSAGIRSRFTA